MVEAHSSNGRLEAYTEKTFFVTLGCCSLDMILILTTNGPTWFMINTALRQVTSAAIGHHVHLTVHRCTAVCQKCKKPCNLYDRGRGGRVERN